MIQIRDMTASDVALGVRLVREANWNQTEADWSRFLSLQPDGCFVAEVDGVPVGTTTTCQFGPVAWIAMVLVLQEYRRRGIATRLMEHALTYLDTGGVRTVRLDATVYGRPVYERLGFVAEYEVARFADVAPATAAQSAPDLSSGRRDGPSHPVHAVSLSADRLQETCELDCQVTGTDRRRLLAALHAEWPHDARLILDDNAVVGFCMLRPGGRATQLGPCAALTAETGRRLLQWALGRSAPGRVFVDIPLDNREAVQWAAQAGLVEQRRFVRMHRGPQVADRPDLMWATTGPEKG
jgi:GNAT superfamily N-acetyltransferase